MTYNNLCLRYSSLFWLYFDGLVQDCSNSIANALELLQSCAEPLIFPLKVCCVSSPALYKIACILILIIWGLVLWVQLTTGLYNIKQSKCSCLNQWWKRSLILHIHVLLGKHHFLKLHYKDVFFSVIMILSNLLYTTLNPNTGSCLCPIHWSQVLSQEWRCSWSTMA